METQYQKEVNDLTGAYGPLSPAMWSNTNSTTGNPWDLNAQPLWFNTNTGLYNTSFEENAAPNGVVEGPTNFGVLGSLGSNTSSTWNPSAFGKRKSKRSRKLHRKSRKSKKTHKGRKSKKSRKSSKTSKSRRFGSCPCAESFSTNLGFGAKIY
jgi:hypothetical protein